jgi:hypothetical protein
MKDEMKRPDRMARMSRKKVVLLSILGIELLYALLDNLYPRKFDPVVHSVPWPLLLPVAIVGLFAYFLRIDLEIRRRRKRAAEGKCYACGYDLRGLNERCPECGTSISSR